MSDDTKTKKPKNNFSKRQRGNNVVGICRLYYTFDILHRVTTVLEIPYEGRYEKVSIRPKS